MIVFLVALLAGCVDLQTHLTLKNQTVTPALIGEDCIPIYFGIGAGTGTVETALKNGRSAVQNFATPVIKPIRAIHSISLSDHLLLGFGQRCIVVAGEP